MVLQFSCFKSTDGGWPTGSSYDGLNNPSGRQKYFFVVPHIVHCFPSVPCLLLKATTCWHSWKRFLTLATVFLHILFKIILHSHSDFSSPANVSLFQCLPGQWLICQEMLSWDSSKRQGLLCSFPQEFTRILLDWKCTFSSIFPFLSIWSFSSCFCSWWLP